MSGGAKGITAQCVVRLAQEYQSRFILMGRSRLPESEPRWAQGIVAEDQLKKAAMADIQARGEKPTPASVSRAVNGVLSGREIADTIRSIREAGGDALYISADITDAEAVRQALTQAQGFGRVNGIIHGAGNLADKLIEKKTPDDFEYVYAAKVKGIENLLAAIPGDQIEYLVLFSSVAGFYGNIGQADYSIANEILNKTAHRFKSLYPNAKVISINWGPWDGGMVTPQLRAYFDEQNIKIIPVEVGTQMLVDELSADTAPVQVVIGSPISPPPKAPDAELRTYTIKRRLDLKASPFLQDHVIDHKAVLPMVSAMSWMASTAEQIVRGYRYFGFENYKVLKGIVFDETLADEYTLQLKELEKSAEEVVLDAMISSETADGKPRFHYSARLRLRRTIPPAPLYAETPDPLAHEIRKPGHLLYEERVLFHNYSFRGVEELIRISPNGLTMRCRLNPIDTAYQGQFPIQAFNYFMADIGLQSIGIWARHFHDAGSLPLRAMHGEHFMNALSGDTFFVNMKVLSVTGTDVSAEITLYDEQNRIFMIVRDIAVTMNKRLNDMFWRNSLPDEARS